MADRKVSELPLAVTASGNNFLYLVQNGVSKRITVAGLLAQTSVNFTNVSSNIIPSADSVYDLGTPSRQWRRLYVSNNTIVIGGTNLSVNSGSLVIGSSTLATRGFVTSSSLAASQIPNDTINISKFVNDEGYLSNTSIVAGSNITVTANSTALRISSTASGGANTGDITFANSTISASNLDEVIVQAIDADSFPTAKLSLEPEYSTAQLSAYSSETTETYTLADGDFASGVWQDNGFGNGVVSFTGAQTIGDFFQNTLQGLTPDNVSIIINNEPAFIWNGGTNGSGTSTPGFGTNPIVPQSPITITSIQFVYRSQSFINVNYDNQEIRLKAQNAGIQIDSDLDIQMYGENNIELQSGADFTISSGEGINISTGSSDYINLSTGDFTVNAYDDVYIEGRDSFRLVNTNNNTPIRIITDENDNEYTWAFNANSTLTTPGDVVIDSGITISQTAITGKEGIGTLYLNSAPNPGAYVHLNETGNSQFAAACSAVITTLGGTYSFAFKDDGTVALPSGSVISEGEIDGQPTLELQPPPTLTSSPEQKLIIKGGNGGDPEDYHLHLTTVRAGCNEIISLFLGTDYQYVKIDSTGDVITEAKQDQYVRLYTTNENRSFEVSLGPDGTLTTPKLKIDQGARERLQIKNDATGVIEHDCSDGHIFYHTSIDANFTANFTNLTLENSEATSLTLVLNQGGTAYIANGVQIANVAQTIKWSNDTIPTGNANAVDVLSFSILRVSDNYIVLGQLSSFG